MSLDAFLRRHVPALQAFSDERLREIVAASQRKEFAAGASIAVHASDPTHVGVVLSGANAGALLGATALLDGRPPCVDPVTESRGDVLLVPLSLLRAAIVAEPAVIGPLLRSIEMLRAREASTARPDAAAIHAGDEGGLELRAEQPERILVVNCGSSSLKYSCYDTADESRAAHGLVERIGAAGTRHRFRGPRGEVKRELPTAGFAEAFSAMTEALTATGSGVLSAVEEVSVVAHRVVHGGKRFTEATLITDHVVAELDALGALAPLHNPVNVAGIRALRALLPGASQVAVFDTAFHHTLPPAAYLYGLPWELYEKRDVRRYGFHGSSHEYVVSRAARFLGRRTDELKIVSCHLGNGASLCAVDHGRSVDTTMGFTPAEGLIMGTRCGDVDAGVLAFLERAEGLTATQSEELLNTKSGLLGLSGVSSDLRDVLKAAGEGHVRALLAIKAFCHRIRKHIGAQIATLGGLDALIFTGGIGQGSAEVRALATQGLRFMGVALDARRNQEGCGDDSVRRISDDQSKVAVLVVPTDEERMLARKALRALALARITRALAASTPQQFRIDVFPHRVHLSREHVEALFGRRRFLTEQADPTQPGPFESREEVSIVGPKGRIERVHVLGPPRSTTQVEVSMATQFVLGIDAPVRASGNVAGTPGCTLEGPAGRVTLGHGVIGAMRQIHMTPEVALRHGVRDGSLVRVRVGGQQGPLLGDVLVRVQRDSPFVLHIDSDDAEVARVQSGAHGRVESIQWEGMP
jgi:acetate kinase